jgi:PAS domain S-box-containing protein
VTSRAEIALLLSRYGSGAALTGLAALTSLEVAPHWSPRHLLWPFYPAVLLAAWLGGPGPGLFATLLSALVITRLYLPSTPSLMVRDPADLIGLLVFLGVGVLFSAVNARLLAAQRRAEAVDRELRREVDERTTVEAVAAKLATIADELQTSVDRYRQQIGSLTAVFRARRDGRIVECSDLFVRLLGAESSDQVLTLRMRDIFLDPAQWQKLTASLTAGGMVENQELRWRRTDGAPLTVLAGIRELDGLVEGIAIDITDRKRAEEVEG